MLLSTTVPKLLRKVVVPVARDRGPGGRPERIAAEVAVHALMLSRWVRAADAARWCKRGRDGFCDRGDACPETLV